jgi:hypothetical protein
VTIELSSRSTRLRIAAARRNVEQLDWRRSSSWATSISASACV